MDRRTRVLVLLIAATLAGTAVVATQFVRIQSTYTFSISTQRSGVQLVASDGAPLSTGFVLRNESGDGQYTLTLGAWAEGTIKTYTAAFAVVNNENVNLRFTRMEITGAAAGSTNLFIWVHENESYASEAGSGAVASGGTLEAGTGTPDACDASDATLRYWAGSAVGLGVNHATDGWVLDNASSSPADGYNGAFTTLTYHHDYPAGGAGNQHTANWIGGTNAVWVDTGNVTHNPVRGVECTAGAAGATNSRMNYAWVEITIVAGSSQGSFAGNLNLYFTAV